MGEQKSITIKQEKKIEEREQRSKKREKRESAIKKKRKDRRGKERRRREKEEEEYARKNLPEQFSDEDEDESEEESASDFSTEDSGDAVLTLKEQLKNFDKIAATGQLFLKYTGKRRRKPQDRVVKVSFDNKYRPKQISWGSGSRHIDFSDILYVAWGHWTPVFDARKDHLKKQLCFSVVGKDQILDVQAQSKEMAELWVKGLRKLIGHSDAKSDKLAKQAFESGNLPGFGGKNKDEERSAIAKKNERTKSLMLLQQDLFVMTTTTVFRNLEEERIWDIDESVMERFNAKSLYELTLREDIPWRQWNHWIREKIVTYLRENNRVINPQRNQQPQYQQYRQPQPMYGQPQYGGQPAYGQPMHRQSQPSYNQLPQMGGQPSYSQPQQMQQMAPVNLPQQPMNTNWNVQPQQMQQMYGQPQQAQQPPQGQTPQQAPQGGGGQGGDNGECSLM